MEDASLRRRVFFRIGGEHRSRAKRTPMAFVGDDALARRVADAMYARDRTAQHMGIEIVDVRVGFARAEMTIREEMLMGHGIAHGGAIFTLADAAFAYACNSRDEANVALQCSISFVEAAKLGDRLVAIAEQQAHANRTGLYDVTVTTGERTIALFRGVPYRLRRGVVEP